MLKSGAVLKKIKNNLTNTALRIFEASIIAHNHIICCKYTKRNSVVQSNVIGLDATNLYYYRYRYLYRVANATYSYKNKLNENNILSNKLPFSR